MQGGEEEGGRGGDMLSNKKQSKGPPKWRGREETEPSRTNGGPGGGRGRQCCEGRWTRPPVQQTGGGTVEAEPKAGNRKADGLRATVGE